MFRGNRLCNLLADFLAYNTTFNIVMKTLVFVIAELTNGVFYTIAQTKRESVPHKTQKNVSDITELFCGIIDLLFMSK